MSTLLKSWRSNVTIIGALAAVCVVIIELGGLAENRVPEAKLSLASAKGEYYVGDTLTLKCDMSIDPDDDSIYCNIGVQSPSERGSGILGRCEFEKMQKHEPPQYSYEHTFVTEGAHQLELAVCEDRAWWQFGKELRDNDSLVLVVSSAIENITSEPTDEAVSPDETAKSERFSVSCSTYFEGNPVDPDNIVELTSSDKFVEVQCGENRPVGDMMKVMALLTFDDEDAWEKGESWYSYRFGGQTNDSETKETSATLSSVDPSVLSRFNSDGFFLPLRAEGGTIGLKSLEFKIDYLE